MDVRSNQRLFPRDNWRVGSSAWAWLQIDTVPTGSNRIITLEGGDAEAAGFAIERYRRLIKAYRPPRSFQLNGVEFLIIAWTDIDAILQWRDASTSSEIARTESRQTATEYEIAAVNANTGAPTTVNQPTRQVTTDRVMTIYYTLGVPSNNWLSWQAVAGSTTRATGNMLILRM